MSKEVTYPVNERFLTWQGEGSHMGRKAFFIRLHGCPIKCPWCDSAQTWHPSYKTESKKMTVSELLLEAQDAHTPIVVITGGEPAIHELKPLVQALQRDGMEVHLETSGALALDTDLFDHITLSPKRTDNPELSLKPSVVKYAQDIKIIVDTPEDINYWLQVLHDILQPDLAGGTGPIEWPPLLKAVWLHPQWGQRHSKAVLEAICEAVATYGDPLRAGYQLHKLYNVDQRDARTVKQVPLGGNLSNGF